MEKHTHNRANTKENANIIYGMSNSFDHSSGRTYTRTHTFTHTWLTAPMSPIRAQILTNTEAGEKLLLYAEKWRSLKYVFGGDHSPPIRGFEK